MFFLMMLISILAMHYVVVIWFLFNTFNSVSMLQRLLPALLSVIFIAGMVLSRTMNNGLSDILSTIVYIWLGALFLCFALVMAVMAVQLVLSIFKVHIGFKIGPAVFAVWFIIAAIAVINGARTPRLVNINLTGASVPQDITIAQISDSHLGDSVSAKRLQKLADKLKEANPDIIFFTGDIFERDGRETQKFIDILNGLNPKYGKYGVLGNHEYYGGVNDNLALWERSGITPLLNSHALAGGINIVGVNDIRTTHLSKEKFSEVLKKSDLNKYTVLLSHTPLYYEEAAQEGVNLMLSGHTHAGQLWPFTYLVGLQFKHIYGEYKHKDYDFMHYVASGTFYWGPPMRFLTGNEVPIIKISKNETAD